MKGRQVDLIFPGASCLLWMGLTRENLSRGLHHTPEINFWAPIYCISSLWHCLESALPPPEEFASSPTTYLRLLVVHLCSVQLSFKCPPPPSFTPLCLLISYNCPPMLDQRVACCNQLCEQHHKWGWKVGRRGGWRERGKEAACMSTLRERQRGSREVCVCVCGGRV